MSQTQKNFDLMKLLNEVKGPLIEIGGPTKDGYDLVDFKKLNKKLLVSNLFPGSPMFIGRPKTEYHPRVIKYFGRVDFIADAFSLPIGDNVVGALFASYFGGAHFKKLALSLKDKKSQPDMWHKGIVSPKIKFSPQIISALAKERTIMRKMAMQEAWRVLEPGGLLVWQGGDGQDLNLAKQNGFEPLFIGLFFYTQVFRKIVADNRETP